MSKSRKTARKSAIRAAITGVFGYVPPDLLTNAELAKMVDTSDEWIVERIRKSRAMFHSTIDRR